MYYVYILETDSEKKFYVGYTNDLKRRLLEHNLGNNVSTKYGVPWKLAYYEAYATQAVARQRERNLKQRGNAYHSLIKRISSS